MSQEENVYYIQPRGSNSNTKTLKGHERPTIFRAQGRKPEERLEIENP
jgi:hypothetical protein